MGLPRSPEGCVMPHSQGTGKGQAASATGRGCCCCSVPGAACSALPSQPQEPPQGKVTQESHSAAADPVGVSEFPPRHSSRPCLLGANDARILDRLLPADFSAMWEQQLLTMYILQQQMELPFAGFLNGVHASVRNEVAWSNNFFFFPLLLDSEYIHVFPPECIQSTQMGFFSCLCSNGCPRAASNPRAKQHQTRLAARAPRTRGPVGTKPAAVQGFYFAFLPPHKQSTALQLPSSSFTRVNKRQLQVARQTRGNNGAHPPNNGLYPRTREQMYTLGHAPLLSSPLAR